VFLNQWIFFAPVGKYGGKKIPPHTEADLGVFV